jgi:hypothetical protein
MRLSTLLWLALLAALFYVLFFATFGNDGTILVGCADVAQTRGGTICLDNAYKR